MFAAISVGLVAQLVEHLTFNPRVDGSSPSEPTKSNLQEYDAVKMTPMGAFSSAGSSLTPGSRWRLRLFGFGRLELSHRQESAGSSGPRVARHL